MKKTLIISGLIILGIFLYINSITIIYVHRQANSICLWINKGEGVYPAVGPDAYEHLTWLKEESKGNYHCEVVEPNRDFYDSDVKTILIKENGIEKIRLNYTLSFGGRSFMQPIYFHHQTSFEHDHNYDRWNYKKMR